MKNIQDIEAPQFTSTSSLFGKGGLLEPKDEWDKLSMAAKAEMMRVAVNHGIYDLQTIRQKYNEFAEGGSLSEEEEDTIVPFEQKTEVVITPDAEYNQYLNTLPDNQRFTPNDKYDSYLYWKLNGRPRNFREAVQRGMFTFDHSDNTYHANSIAFDDNTGIGYFMKPKDHNTVGYELDWFNKGLVTEEGGHQRPETPEEKAESDIFRHRYTLMTDPDRPNYYRYQPVEYASGGHTIHIKPENRGKFTALKKRTGHSASWFKAHGTPAQKKMAVFALNSRKWKHGEGGNLFEGISQPTQKMQIGLNVQGWPSYSLEQIVANGERVQRQRQALEEAVVRLGRNQLIESNDATAVANDRLQNQHLIERTIKGAKANAVWGQDHPNLTAWGNTLATIPFVIASAPALDAIASTTIGQGVASGLNYISNTAKAIPYISKALPWAEAALATGSATHGVQEMKNGTFTPITALEVSPLAPPTIGIGNNLYLPHLREHLYASKAPIGYDGIIPAAKRMAEGILSGRRADIESPFWFNNESAKTLGESYAFVPTKIPETEKAQYIKEFGQRALKARADIWRMYNRLPQKYNTFVESNKYPGAYTASEDIKALKWVPFPDKNVDPGDFVNSVGGNVGLPQIINLGKGFPDAGYTSKEFGVTTLSDLWDLYPFSRPNDRLISRMQRGYQKAFNSTEAPKFNWLKPLDEKLAKFEVGKLVNAKPIMVKNDIPWTMDRKLVTDANGNLNFRTSYTQGFHSDNILPQSVIDWKAGKPLIEDADIKFNPEDYDFLKMRLTTKSRKK